MCNFQRGVVWLKTWACISFHQAWETSYKWQIHLPTLHLSSSFQISKDATNFDWKFNSLWVHTPAGTIYNACEEIILLFDVQKYCRHIMWLP